jgi:uncharacterized protein (DUF1800 family)
VTKHPNRPRRRLPWRLGAAVWTAGVVLLAGCGGGDGADGNGEGPSGAGALAVAEVPQSRAEAARFLTQATFGPTEADIQRVMAVGYAAWIDEQLARPASSHRAYWDAADAAIKAAKPDSGAGQDQVLESFWKAAIAGEDQLRQRMAYALSQIFVISMQDGGVAESPRAVAAWLDMLAGTGLGNYRDLLEAVSRHPLMGRYLSHLRNQKADPKTGRVPDENYAREVMQLFSIGLVELNSDGTARAGGDGQPLATYGPADIAGLAKVFTGWSWSCPEWPDNGCFYSGSANGSADPDRSFKPMMGYPQYHSAEEKSFLGLTLPAQSPSSPEASLTAALDHLAAHPNVGPFIGRQLIQRLVTSNPSPQYVAAVAAAFQAGGGDLRAMLKAVLMHPEARAAGTTAGKVREPVLRLSALLRAFGFKSDSGAYKVGNTDSPSSALGQTPLRSPSVFNFYRPGYVPPGTEAGSAGLAVPELQLAHETSASGYVNYMRDNVAGGVGQWNSGTNRRDLQPDFSAELALAEKPAELVDLVTGKLLADGAPAALQAEIAGAIEKMAVPALKADGSNSKQVNDAKRARVNAAVFLALVSPEFLVQK